MNASAARAGTHKAGSYEPDLIARARAGNERALIDVFDAVIYDIYSFAYLETGSVDEAERIADMTGADLPEILFRYDVFTLEDVRSRLLQSAAIRVEQLQRSQAHLQALGGIRASFRHLFLAGSAVVVLAYAGLTVLR